MGTSLAVQWLKFDASNAGVTGSIYGRGTKIPTCCLLWPKITKIKIKRRQSVIPKRKKTSMSVVT